MERFMRNVGRKRAQPRGPPMKHVRTCSALRASVEIYGNAYATHDAEFGDGESRERERERCGSTRGPSGETRGIKSPVTLARMVSFRENTRDVCKCGSEWAFKSRAIFLTGGGGMRRFYLLDSPCYLARDNSSARLQVPRVALHSRFPRQVLILAPLKSRERIAEYTECNTVHE